jgi:hypothetical protein
MSGKLAYRLAVILMISPLVVLPSLVIYQMHLRQQYKAEVEAARAKAEAQFAQMEADQRARQSH